MCGNEFLYFLFFVAFSVTSAILLKLIWKRKRLSSETTNDKKEHNKV